MDDTSDGLGSGGRATEQELMAIFGWAEPRTAAIHTRKANRKRLAVQAVSRMMEELDSRGPYSPHTEPTPRPTLSKR